MKLAIAQIRVEGGRLDKNLLRAERAIEEAPRSGADMVLLPEALDCGWTDPAGRKLAQPIPDGLSCKRLRNAARERRIFVCAGLVERAGTLFYNAAVLFSPQGELLLHYRKIHELEIAQALYSSGDRLSTTQTPFGRIGVMICADAFAPELCISRTLGAMGAQLILSPCAWAVPADHDQAREPYGELWRECYRPVARKFQLWIAAASNVGPIDAGPWAGRKCIGCSLAIAPDGGTAVQGPYGEDAEALLLVDVDCAPR